MPLPLLPIIGAALLAKAGADIYSGVRSSRAADRAAEAAKKDARRAAIERAMGGTALGRGPTIVNPPDLTIPSVFGGLAGVAGSVAGMKYGGG
jgi:hypothetical protein